MMLADTKKLHRRSIRLKNYHYSQNGMYFVTICTHQRASLFGEVVDGVMNLNAQGQYVLEEWHRSAQIRKEIVLDEFVVMPNHVHGIIIIENDDIDFGGRGTARPAPTVERFGKPVRGSIPTIIRSFKSAVTKRINQLNSTPSQPVWQRNYHEHIIRNETALNQIRQYIRDNPMNWEKDNENPINVE